MMKCAVENVMKLRSDSTLQPASHHVCMQAQWRTPGGASGPESPRSQSGLDTLIRDIPFAMMLCNVTRTIWLTHKETNLLTLRSSSNFWNAGICLRGDRKTSVHRGLR